MKLGVGGKSICEPRVDSHKKLDDLDMVAGKTTDAYIFWQVYTVRDHRGLTIFVLQVFHVRT